MSNIKTLNDSINMFVKNQKKNMDVHGRFLSLNN